MVMAHQQQHQQQLKQAQQQQVFNSQAQSQQQQQASLIRQQHPQHPAPQQQPQQQQQSSQQQQTRAEAHSPQGPSQAALQLWQLWGNQDRTPQAGEVQMPVAQPAIKPDGTADPGVKENALRTVQTATRAAEKAVLTAARLAAAAGLDYSAPAGFQVDLTGIERLVVDYSVLEQQAVQASQRMAARQLQRQQIQAAGQQQMQQVAAQIRQQQQAGGAQETVRHDSEQRPPGQQQAAQPQQPPAAKPEAQSKSKASRSGSKAKAKSSGSGGLDPGVHAKFQQAHEKVTQQSSKDHNAWSKKPPKDMLLRLADMKPALKQKWLQLFWPEDKRWWPGQITDINTRTNLALLLYETGEEEEVNLADMIRKQEVAWLDANDMPVHGDSDYEESDENEPDAEEEWVQQQRQHQQREKARLQREREREKKARQLQQEQQKWDQERQQHQRQPYGFGDAYAQQNGAQLQMLHSGYAQSHAMAGMAGYGMPTQLPGAADGMMPSVGHGWPMQVSQQPMRPSWPGAFGL